MFKNALNKPKIDLQVRPSRMSATTPNVSNTPKLIEDEADLICYDCDDKGCHKCNPNTAKPDWRNTPNPASMPQNADDYPRIERVLNKQRIDLFFKEKPRAEVRRKMKDQGGWWNQDRMCWEFRDTFGNRGWLGDNFGAEFPEEVAETPPEQPKPQIVVAQEEPVPALAKYRQQVDELIAVLDVRPADLILIAIDFLHQAKVNKH